MPVRNNITGIWRHLRLNESTLYSGYTSDRSLTADQTAASARQSLDQLFMIVENANFESQQSVSPTPLMQGTAKTKVVTIKEATDTLSITGPMLLAESDDAGAGATATPKIVMAETNNQFGDASTIATAYLYSALSFDPTLGITTTVHSYAKEIKMDLSANGFNWTVNVEGDPTSLRPAYCIPAQSTIPYGYFGDGTLTPSPKLETALRVAVFYDFYILATVKMAVNNGGTIAYQNTSMAGVIESMTSTISISAEPTLLIGRGQAPIFTINHVAMSGSMSVIFPLLDTVGNGEMPTPVPTWQAVPEPWGDAKGFRDIVGGVLDPAPNAGGVLQFPDTPDQFYIDEISIVPLYVSNGKPILDSTAFGMDPSIDLSQMPVVIKQASENIGPGLIKSQLSYEVIFRE